MAKVVAKRIPVFLRSLLPGPWGHGGGLEQLECAMGHGSNLRFPGGMGRPRHQRMKPQVASNLESLVKRLPVRHRAQVLRAGRKSIDATDRTNPHSAHRFAILLFAILLPFSCSAVITG